MKYMGSKRWMLKNGLGHLIHDEIRTSKRFVDLFSGSGAVAQFAATSEHSVEVVAFDLQLFCVVLAQSVIGRNVVINPEPIWAAWHKRAQVYLAERRKKRASDLPLPTKGRFTQAFVREVREECQTDFGFPLTRAYGGHYFSRRQSLWLDALRTALPREEPSRSVALAALIEAASHCAAAPGHTAQPFQATRGAKKFLFESWSHDVVLQTQTTFTRICRLHANQCGKAEVKNANDAAGDMREGDLVFIDPPYSGVHYSRFYHVLETVARGTCSDVSGVGRYPPQSERPRSSYSVSSEAVSALDGLLRKISANGARAILTFPEHDCSNGLSGEIVASTAEKYFKTETIPVINRFSTLGGTMNKDGAGYGRTARQQAKELIFRLEPR